MCWYLKKNVFGQYLTSVNVNVHNIYVAGHACAMRAMHVLFTVFS